MGRWVWRNDDGSIEVPPNDLANHLTQSVNTYKNQQQGKVSQIGAYVQNGGTWEQNMTQLGQQLNPQQRQPVAYWNPNTNVVYAGGMPTQMPQVFPIGYGYSPGYGTAPLVYDTAQGQYVGGSMNQFGPTGNATVPMTTGTTVSPAASNTTGTKSSNNQPKQITDVVQKEEQDAIKNSTYNVDNPGNVGINIDDDSYTEPIKPARVEYTQEEFENLSDTNPSALQNYVDFFSQMKKQNPERFGNMNILEFVNFYRRHGYLR